MTMRLATVSDAGALAELHVRSWQAAYAGILPKHFLDALDVDSRIPGWVALLRDGDGIRNAVVVAEDEGRLLGFVWVRPAQNEGDAETGEVASMYVTPEHWREGVGRELMTAALAKLVGGGFRTAVLWVLAENQPAITFFESNGWRADGGTKSEIIAGTKVTELRMSRELSRL